MTSQEKPIPARMNTSITDNQVYPQVCLQAAYDYRYFLNFRREKDYVGALEHVPERIGRICYDLIKDDASVAVLMDQFRQNDLYGNPLTFNHEDLGDVSATTLRYIRILIALKHFFGSLDGMNICEIGVGYGGQCRVANVMWEPRRYRLVDIQPALALAQRFLDHFILPSVMSYQTMNQLNYENYDLVISNYAFTELPRAIQDVYLKKVILRAKKGYILYNEITPASFRSYKAAELKEMIDGAEISEEYPLTHKRNCVITWGHQ